MKNIMHFRTPREIPAHNKPASAAGVFRETFAGRRRPAPLPDTVTCGEGRGGECRGGAAGSLMESFARTFIKLADGPHVKSPPGPKPGLGQPCKQA